MNRSKILIGLVFAAMAVSVVNPARATLLAYEGFDYPEESGIGGKNGGFLWTSAWSTASSATLATNVNGLGLGHSFCIDENNCEGLEGSQLATLLVGSLVGPTAVTATPNRLLPNNLSGGAGTVAGPGRTNWISLLYQRLKLFPNPYLRQANFGLFEGSTERLSVGGPNTSATVSNVFSLWGSGAHNQAAPYQASDFPLYFDEDPDGFFGQMYFILIRIVTDGTTNADSCHVWLNYPSLTEPTLETATLTNFEVNLSSVNTVRFQCGNANANGDNAVMVVDELRVGTTFADVTPNTGNGSAPRIDSPPSDLTVAAGDPASFSVIAGGLQPLAYRWYFNTNTLLAGATNATFTRTSAQTNHSGTYQVVVTNYFGAVTSEVAVLTVLPPAPPAITNSPSSFAVIAGNPATLSVAATGFAPLRYQWWFNGSPLAGATNLSIAFAPAQTNHSGNYQVVITNTVGAVTSSVATLNVIYPGPPGLPAFPGADGAARHVTGGRGGTVYHVTQLDRNFGDTNAGTLRYGLTDANFSAGPRTIVFDIAGTFWLGRYGTERPEYDNGWDTQSRYNIPNNVTVAGQTAPGPVIIMGGVTKPGGNNIIVRNVMFAPGYGMKSFNEPDSDPPKVPTVGDFPDAVVYDALDVSGQNVMLDHLTCIYGTDETISCNELASNLTVQYCTMAQGENYPQADAENPGYYGGHALGSLLQAGANAKVSVIHNLYAHLANRLPRVGSETGTGALNDFRNNVFYNWYFTAGYGVSTQPSFNNFINNFYLAGPGGNDVSGTNITTGNSGGTDIFDGANSAVNRAYVTGNLKDTNKDGDPLDTSSADASYSSVGLQSTAYDVNVGVTLSAQSGFTNVLRYVGARWWARPYDFTLGNTNTITTNDIAVYVDERLIQETVTGTGQIISWADDPFDSSPSEGVEWRSLLSLRADSNNFAAPFNRSAGWDTDGDGMPDAWEIEHGLDPSVPNNNSDFDNDGYTDLEEYLNDIAAWPAPGVITFNNTANNRYAEIFNWSVSGVTVNIGGTNIPTFSKWQPSRYDTVLISNRTCVVDAVGQRAGIVRLATNATLSITNGWLNVADKVEISAGCTIAVQYSGALKVTNGIVNNGTLRLTGSAGLTVGSITNNGLLDVMTWSGTLPSGFVNNGVVLDYSLVKVGSATMNGTNFVVTIQGYTGHNYQLQYRDDLLSGIWNDVDSAVPGNNAPIILTHIGGATAQKRLYRVTISP